MKNVFLILVLFIIVIGTVACRPTNKTCQADWDYFTKDLKSTPREFADSLMSINEGEFKAGSDIDNLWKCLKGGWVPTDGFD